MCIVLFRVLPLPPFPSFLPQTTENASLPSTRPPGLWVPVSPIPAEPCDRRAPETRGDRAKKLHLDEIYRSVPAMPPGAEQKARLQISRDAFSVHVLYISKLAPRAWSGMTGVVNSLKLYPCDQQKLLPKNIIPAQF